MKLVFAMLVVFVGWPSRADACKCTGPIPVCQSTWEHAAVFVARVEQFTRTPERDVIVFDVLEAFRGVQPGRLEMTVRFGTCSQPFEPGREYVIYASGRADQLTTSICSGNRLVEDAAEDLAYLRSLASMGARTLGELRGTARVLRTDDSRSPLPGRAVTITGTGTSYSARTQPDGSFAIRLPPDTYVVSVDALGLSTIPSPWPAVLKDARGCVVADVLLQRSRD